MNVYNVIPWRENTIVQYCGSKKIFPNTFGYPPDSLYFTGMSIASINLSRVSLYSSFPVRRISRENKFRVAGFPTGSNWRKKKISLKIGYIKTEDIYHRRSKPLFRRNILFGRLKRLFNKVFENLRTYVIHKSVMERFQTPSYMGLKIW